MSATTNPPIKFQGDVVNGAPAAAWTSDGMKRATGFTVSAYSDRDVLLHIYQRKPYDTWHTKKTYTITGGAASEDHAIVVRNLFGPILVEVENEDTENDAAVEVEVIVEAVG